MDKMEDHAYIVCVGSLVYDIMSYVPRMPKPGESLPGCKIVTEFGGKGANPAVAISRLGGKVAMIGKVGKDTYGNFMIENFRNLGINSNCIFETTEASSGTAIVIIETTGENRILGDMGANMCLTKEEIQSVKDLIAKAKVLICNFEVSVEATKESLIIAKEYNVISILNAAPAIKNPDPVFYMLPDIFCLNETEAEIITNMSIEEHGFQKLASELIRRGCRIVVLTLGSKGVYIHSEQEKYFKLIEAHKVTPVDTTGAGDAFVGALAFYMAYFEDLSLSEQVRRASYFASLSVQKRGTQASYPFKEEMPKEMF